MTPKQIKFLDYWIGIPILFILTFWKNCISFLSGKKIALPEKIIFIKLIEQGATVQAYSAIKEAVNIVGADSVFFLVFEENVHILKLLDVIPPKNIITIRNKNIISFIIDTIKAVVFINKNKINTAIDMEFFSRFSAILTYLTGAKNRVGYHRFNSELSYRGNLMTNKIQYNPYIHVSQAYFLMVDCLKQNNDLNQMVKCIVNQPNCEVKKYVQDINKVELIKSVLVNELNDALDFPIIIINPNIVDMIPLRKWDTTNYIKLSNKLLDFFNNKITIVITGRADEQKACEEIRNKTNAARVINLAGKTQFEDLFSLYSISEIIITNDSGPGHFASMTNIKTIVLFGPETPKLFGPKGDNVIIIESGLSCSPCVNPFNHRFSPCKDNLCMKSIDVESVFSLITELMNTKKTTLNF